MSAVTPPWFRRDSALVPQLHREEKHIGKTMENDTDGGGGFDQKP